MKKIILFSIASLGLLSLNSCKSVGYSYRAVDVNKKNIITQEVVVDVKLDLKNKISSTSSKRKSIDEAIDEAYYKAIVDNNIDVVVDPIFEVTTTDKILFFGGKTVAKLTGFGARYENPRNKLEAVKELKTIDTTDVEKFERLYGENIPKKSESKRPTDTAKKRWWLWAAIIAVVATVIK
jgi:hypothetical protein